MAGGPRRSIGRTDAGRKRAVENTAGNARRSAISFARTRVTRRLRQPRRSLRRGANRHSEKLKRTRTRDLGATRAIAWSGKFGLNGSMKISLGTDHAGFNLKEKVKGLLAELGHEVKDFGTFSAEPPVDYPLFVRPAAEAVARGECDRGIVFGGSGNGEAMTANKVRGIRCALCWNEEVARLSRQHNDANVLSLGERVIPEDTALAVVRVWLTTDFEGGRHIRRIAEIESM